MFLKTMEPRFSETDAMGHINNNSYSVWFEVAREPIFRFFSPDLDLKNSNLIMAHISCDFHSEVFYGREILIKTAIEKIGRSSVNIKHALYQNNKLCTTGKAVLIHYDYNEKKSIEIDESIKCLLKEHICEKEWNEFI